MALNNQCYKIVLLLTTCLVVTCAITISPPTPTTGPTCQGPCPTIPTTSIVEVYPPTPQPGECYPTDVFALVYSCPVGYSLEIGCSGLSFDEIRCVENINFTTDLPPPPCPTQSSPCPSSSTDTVLIVVIVVLALLLLLSWAGLLLLCCRKGKCSATHKKETGNEYTPAPKKVSNVKEKRKKEKMSISARPPLPNPRPTNDEAVQEEYAYIDPVELQDDAANEYLEVEG